MLTVLLVVLAAVAVGGVLNTRRRTTRDTTAPAHLGEVRLEARPKDAERRAPRGPDRAELLRAFRSDEMPVAHDAEREDQRKLVAALQLLADHVGAHEAVLWEPFGDSSGRLLPMAWSRGAEPPSLGESARSLIEWSAQEGRVLHSADDVSDRLLAIGTRLGDRRGAVSVHFAEEPTLGRTTIAMWLDRHAHMIATMYEVVQTRAELAKRTHKLRSMIRAATTLQGSRDPAALAQTLTDDACFVSGAEWAVLVRWDAAKRAGMRWTQSKAAPPFPERAPVQQGALVGDVCLSGVPRVFSDAHVLVAGRDSLFDAVPLPSGTRSLIVVPLRRSSTEPVIGALLCGHSERLRLSNSDAHATRDLGIVAAGALETAWTVQDETLAARTDQLTGLPNRRHFEERFERMIGETDRYGGSSALVLMDVDHFKVVNDTSGHEAGDLVLVALGQSLTAQRRTTDFAARLGGEELALLLPQTDSQGALEVAERCRQAIETLAVHTPGGEIRVTASFGVALYAARSGLGDRLYERADRALYAAKHGGRNRVEMATAASP